MFVSSMVVTLQGVAVKKKKNYRCSIESCGVCDIRGGFQICHLPDMWQPRGVFSMA